MMNKKNKKNMKNNNVKNLIGFIVMMMVFMHNLIWCMKINPGVERYNIYSQKCHSIMNFSRIYAILIWL